MSYSPSWTNQNSSGHVTGDDSVAAADLTELEGAANRRLRVIFDPGGDRPIDLNVSPGNWIAATDVAAARSAFDLLLPSGSYFTHAGGWFQLSVLNYWLNPNAGDDENAFIVLDTKPPAAGEVGFLATLNGGTGWSAGATAGSPIQAGHVNELRDAAALLSRGRYILRVGDGGSAKASKALPGGLWYPPAVARDGSHEMHSWFGGRDWLWVSDGGNWLGTRGQNVAVRAGSKVRLRPLGGDVKIRLYHCKRAVNSANFSWTHYDAAAGSAWSTAGGTGGADAAHLADLELTNSDWTEHTDAALLSVLQQMADGSAEPTFMLAPNEDTGWGDDPVHVDVEVVLDFDLDTPPA